MADLITGSTSYPNMVDTATTLNNETDDIIAEHINGPAAAVVAIETMLGTIPQGTADSLKARLAIVLADSGGIHSGLTLPSPALSNSTHFFYTTLSEKLYVYDTVSAAYVELTTATSLGAYLQASADATITGNYTFNPAVAGSKPFTIGANAEDIAVPHLNADLLDGLHANQVDADKVDGQHAVLNIGTDHNHSAAGAQGGLVDHTSLTSKGTNTHSDIDTALTRLANTSGTNTGDQYNIPGNAATADDAAVWGGHYVIERLYVAPSWTVGQSSDTTTVEYTLTNTTSGHRQVLVAIASSNSALVGAISWRALCKDAVGVTYYYEGGNGTRPAMPTAPSGNNKITLIARNNNTAGGTIGVILFTDVIVYG
jgi:hypothetical protein